MSGALFEGGGPNYPNLVNGSIVGAAGLVTLNSNGTYSISTGLVGNWIDAPYSAAGSGYDVKIDVTAGTFDSGTTGAFVNIGAGQTWQKSTVGTVTYNYTLRHTASGVTVKTQTGLTMTVS